MHSITQIGSKIQKLPSFLHILNTIILHMRPLSGMPEQPLPPKRPPELLLESMEGLTGGPCCSICVYCSVAAARDWVSPQMLAPWLATYPWLPMSAPNMLKLSPSPCWQVIQPLAGFLHKPDKQVSPAQRALRREVAASQQLARLCKGPSATTRLWSYSCGRGHPRECVFPGQPWTGPSHWLLSSSWATRSLDGGSVCIVIICEALWGAHL